MRLLMILGAAALIAACSETSTQTASSTAASGGATTSTAMGGAAAGGALGQGGHNGGSPPVPVDLSCTPGPYDACDSTLPLPSEVKTLIDLTDPASVIGRCDSAVSTWDPEHHTLLPNDPDAYPLVVHISAAGFDGTCSYCDGNEPAATSYGVAIALPYALWSRTGQTAILAVNEPWSIVAGGCGKACAIPCLEGYQEFQQTGCLGSYAREFGVATDVDTPPDAYLLVDLADNLLTPCCPWQCEG